MPMFKVITREIVKTLYHVEAETMEEALNLEGNWEYTEELSAEHSEVLSVEVME